MLISGQFSCQRPYHAEHTGSRPITEVKQRRASSVLGWVTAWEHGVLLALKFFFCLRVPFICIVTHFLHDVEKLELNLLFSLTSV